MIPPTFTEETKREFRERLISSIKYGWTGNFKPSFLEGWFISRTQAAFELGLSANEQYKSREEAYQQGRAETLKEVREASLEILEEHFPKQNQDDPRVPSPNGHGAVMAYRGLLLARLTQ